MGPNFRRENGAEWRKSVRMNDQPSVGEKIPRIAVAVVADADGCGFSREMRCIPRQFVICCRRAAVYVLYFGFL